MVMYINNLNVEWDLNYKYVSSDTWNPSRYVLNRTFATSDIGSGHCVISIFMITHLLSLTKFDVKIIYEMLASMSDTEVLYLINCYTSYVIGLIA